MRNIFIFLFLITCNVSMFAQEFNANVVVNAQLTGNENLQQFKTLENQLKEFISNTKWTNKTFQPQERINCNLVIITAQHYKYNRLDQYLVRLIQHRFITLTIKTFLLSMSSFKT